MINTPPMPQNYFNIVITDDLSRMSLILCILARNFSKNTFLAVFSISNELGSDQRDPFFSLFQIHVPF